MTAASSTDVVVEYVQRDMASGELWLDVRMNGEPYCQIGPFDTWGERERVLQDLLRMTRQLGAKDLPTLPQ